MSLEAIINTVLKIFSLHYFSSPMVESEKIILSWLASPPNVSAMWRKRTACESPTKEMVRGGTTLNKMRNLPLYIFVTTNNAVSKSKSEYNLNTLQLNTLYSMFPSFYFIKTCNLTIYIYNSYLYCI